MLGRTPHRLKPTRLPNRIAHGSKTHDRYIAVSNTLPGRANMRAQDTIILILVSHAQNAHTHYWVCEGRAPIKFILPRTPF